MASTVIHSAYHASCATNETLKKIAPELNENLKKNISVDRAERESVPATLRLMGLHQAQEAVELVLQQVDMRGQGLMVQSKNQPPACL